MWAAPCRRHPLVTAGLCLFGAGMGGGEVAVNVDGADVERITGTAVLPTLHGCFSLGTVIGGSAGMAATAAASPSPGIWPWSPWSPRGFWSTPCVPFPPASASAPRLDAGVPVRPAQRSKPQVWKDRKLLLIGAIVLAMALAEGAANDWLPLLMVDGHGLDAAMGSLVYVGFAAAMTLGRFSGTFFLGRFGRAAVVRASAVSGAVGLLLVIFSDNAVVAATAVLFWGLGASLGFPVALSAAGDSGPDQTARVSLVAIIGYVAFLVGPPALGFLGDHYGLRSAMVVVLVFVASAVLIAPAADTRDRTGAAADLAKRTPPSTNPAGQPTRRPLMSPQVASGTIGVLLAAPQQCAGLVPGDTRGMGTRTRRARNASPGVTSVRPAAVARAPAGCSKLPVTTGPRRPRPPVLPLPGDTSTIRIAMQLMLQCCRYGRS